MIKEISNSLFQRTQYENEQTTSCITHSINVWTDCIRLENTKSISSFGMEKKKKSSNKKHWGRSQPSNINHLDNQQLSLIRCTDGLGLAATTEGGGFDLKKNA